MVDASSGKYWIQYAETHLISVRHGQDRKPSVFLPGFLSVPGFYYILAEIAVAQHYSLGLAGCPRSVDYHCQIIR